MDEAIKQQVWERAGACCEYCLMPQAHDELPFEIDHVIPQQHGGPTTLANLALACFGCRRGPNLAGVDPKTKKIVRLFHPRRHKWHRHFRCDGPFLVGRTPIGRATVMVLALNLPLRIRHRAQLMAEGAWPSR
jgi:hypothetical protein